MKKSFDIIFKECEGILKKIDSKKISGKKILIVGANAFLSTYIYSFFFIKNYDLKKKNKNKLTLVSKSNPKKIIKYILSKDRNIKFSKVDLVKGSKINNILKKKYDYIFYLATYGQPKLWLQNQLETISLNTSVLQNVFENIKFKKTKLIYFSSIDVYGDPINSKKKPINEKTPCSFSLHSERISYGEAKRMGEVICMNYKKKFNMDVKIIRPAHTYGPGMSLNDNKVVIDFIKKGKKNNLSLLDGGKSLKTFGYISDVCEMILNIAIHGKNNVYNVSGKSQISIYDLAKVIAKYFNIKKIDFKNNIIKPNHIGNDPKKLFISSKLYCDEFSKKKFVGINEGVNFLIKYLYI